MNMSRVVSHLKMQLGLYGVTLPFVDDITKEPVPTENVIRDVLTTSTIPMYSQFVPWVRSGDCDIKQLRCLDEHEGIYLLPAFLTLTPVMYVSNVSLPMVNTRGTYGDIAPAYGINRSVEGVATSTAYMMLAGLMRAEPTFEYLGQNKIKLYGYPKTVLTFEVACEHDPNGETIEDSCYDSFLELATADLKIFLYNTLKMYNEIPTAFGTINLKVDDFRDGESERNQLLERWRDTYHLDMPWYQFMG